MFHYKKILSLLLLVALSMTANANGARPIEYANAFDTEKKDNVMTIDVFLNNNSKFQMIDVPTVGRLDIYSILGVKVDSKILNNNMTSYYIDLPKGVYIFKAGKVAQKVIAR